MHSAAGAAEHLLQPVADRLDGGAVGLAVERVAGLARARRRSTNASAVWCPGSRRKRVELDALVRRAASRQPLAPLVLARPAGQRDPRAGPRGDDARCSPRRPRGGRTNASASASRATGRSQMRSTSGSPRHTTGPRIAVAAMRRTLSSPPGARRRAHDRTRRLARVPAAGAGRRIRRRCISTACRRAATTGCRCSSGPAGSRSTCPGSVAPERAATSTSPPPARRASWASCSTTCRSRGCGVVAHDWGAGAALRLIDAAPARRSHGSCSSTRSARGATGGGWCALLRVPLLGELAIGSISRRHARARAPAGEHRGGVADRAARRGVGAVRPGDPAGAPAPRSRRRPACRRRRAGVPADARPRRRGSRGPRRALVARRAPARRRSTSSPARATGRGSSPPAAAERIAALLDMRRAAPTLLRGGGRRSPTSLISPPSLDLGGPPAAGEAVRRRGLRAVEQLVVRRPPRARLQRPVPAAGLAAHPAARRRAGVRGHRGGV